DSDPDASPRSGGNAEGDGGFFFMLGDSIRNKAGASGHQADGREIYASYGSATADGLRALLLCDMSLGSPRVVAALEWLETHFSASTHAGAYPPERESARQAVYFYYCHSLALAFQAAGVRKFEQNGRRVHWAEELADELIRRQKSDGSWINSSVDVREDD